MRQFGQGLLLFLIRGRLIRQAGKKEPSDNANHQKFWVKPESGLFQTWQDLEGSYMVGSPDDIVREVEKYLEVGIDHIVFDLRFRFDEWDLCMELLGKEVLPRVRKLSGDKR